MGVPLQANKMKKLLILNDVGPENAIGGQASFLKNLLPFLKSRYETTLLILPGYLQSISFLPWRLLYLLFLLSKIRTIRKAEIIFSHTMEASFLVSLIKPQSLFHVFHGNSNPLTTSKFWYGKYFRSVFSYFEKVIVKRAKACITVGEPRTDAIKINQPINRSLFVNPATQVLRQNLLFVGRLEEVKQIDRLIEIFKKAIDDHGYNGNLIICGEGTKETELRALVSKTGLNGRVIFTGMTSYSDVINYMRSSEMLLMASLFEGFPMVIAEALFCGLPVVSTNVGSISEIVKNEYNGYILATNFTDEQYCSCISDIKERLAHFSLNAKMSASVFDAEKLVEEDLVPIFNLSNR